MKNHIYINGERIKRLETFYLPNTGEEIAFNEGFDRCVSDAVFLLEGNDRVMDDFQWGTRPFTVCRKLFEIERQIELVSQRIGYQQGNSTVDSLACSVVRKSDIGAMVGFMKDYLADRKKFI